MNFVHFPCFSTLVDLCKLHGVVVSTLNNNKRIFIFYYMGQFGFRG